MGRVMRWSLLPLVAAVAALFSVLPHTGGDATVRAIASGRAWRFTPGVVRLDRGARLAFTNDSKVTHTATCSGCAPNAAWDTGDVQPGQTAFLAFETDATYTYFCRYHRPLLAGRLVVGDGGPAPPGGPAPGAPTGGPPLGGTPEPGPT